MSDRQIDVKIGSAKESTAVTVTQALEEAERKDAILLELLEAKVADAKKVVEAGLAPDEEKLNVAKRQEIIKERATVLEQAEAELKVVKIRDYERKKAIFKRRVANVLDRGFLVDRLRVTIPPEDGLWQEWVPNTPQDLARARLLGFEFDTKYAVNRSINDGGDNTAMVGDVISMVQPMYMHEALEEEKLRIYHETHSKREQKEEKNFREQNEQIGMPPIVNSKFENVSGPELTERMTAKT